MGKGNSKGFKVKSYKPPPEKYVVVVNAWGFCADKTAYFNNVAAWFEIMLRRCYPEEKIQVSCIYFQNTHRNLIVELPDSVEDVKPLLGAHPYAAFLTNASAIGNPGIAELYEYDFRGFNHPEQTNWQLRFPTYTEIPAKFPVQDPYPLPSDAPGLFPVPIPPPNAPYAVRLPAAEVVGPFPPASPPRVASGSCSGPAIATNGSPMSPQRVPPTGNSPGPSLVSQPAPPAIVETPQARAVVPAFTPYIPPSHHPSHSQLTTARSQAQQLVQQQLQAVQREPPRKKIDIDPYEEDEDARRLLASPPEMPIKRELGTAADDFLLSMGSLLNQKQQQQQQQQQQGAPVSVKPEPVDDHRLPSPQPSPTSFPVKAEPQDSLQQLSLGRNATGHSAVGNIPLEEFLRGDEDYEPSAALVALLQDPISPGEYGNGDGGGGAVDHEARKRGRRDDRDHLPDLRPNAVKRVKREPVD